MKVEFSQQVVDFVLLREVGEVRFDRRRDQVGLVPFLRLRLHLGPPQGDHRQPRIGASAGQLGQSLEQLARLLVLAATIGYVGNPIVGSQPAPAVGKSLDEGLEGAADLIPFLADNVDLALQVECVFARLGIGRNYLTVKKPRG